MKSDLISDSLQSETKPVRMPKTWPHVIRNVDVAVKIYKNKGHIRGENFPTFLLSYYASGKRQLRRFMDFAKASEEATRIAMQKAQGALGAAALSARDRVSLEQALALLAKNEGIGNASVALNPCEEQAENVGNALGDRFERAAARAKVSWKRNGFRHSYISYRVAVLKDVPAVALECGNSPQVIFSNYRALATDPEAKDWFSILPPKKS